MIYECAPEVFKTNEYQLPAYSMIRLDTQYNIPCFAESIEYTNSLSNLMAKSGKKTLILTSNEHMSLVNFLANGLTYVNNPSIQFMALDENYLYQKNTHKVYDINSVIEEARKNKQTDKSKFTCIT